MHRGYARCVMGNEMKYLIITNKGNLTVETNSDKFELVSKHLKDAYPIAAIDFANLEETYLSLKAGQVDLNDDGWIDPYEQVEK